MSDTNESQTDTPDRRNNWENGMEAILEKLMGDAKSITLADAQSLADNAEAGNWKAAQIVTMVKDIAIHETTQSTTDDQVSTNTSTPDTRILPEMVIDKLRTDPASISTEDARRFSENVEARDARSARLISAVESLAAVREDLHGTDTSLGQTPHTSLLTVVKDLLAAVENCPEDVDVEILKTTQGVVSKMQNAVGHTNAPHPELEAELQQEYAQVLPKIERGTVSKAEADHLHSLEARAHGRTERGGLAATAQSIAAKCERQSSTSSGSGSGQFRTNNRNSHDQGQRRSENDGTSSSGVSVTRNNMDPTRTSLSPTKSRRNQSLSDQTNTIRKSVQDYAQHQGITKDSIIRSSEKDPDRGSIMSHAYPSSLKSENSSRHKREKSQV